MSELSLEGHLHRRCGGHYALAVEEVTIRLSGMTARVDRAMYKCDKCADRQHTVEQREDAEREAILTMRTQHHLMTGKDIRHFRESVGLSTAQLGELLHGLPKGIVEGWEKGRYLQSPAVDAMLRSLTEPEERERRAVRAGFLLPPLPGTLPAESASAAESAEESRDSVDAVSGAESAETTSGSVDAVGVAAGSVEPVLESGRVHG